MSQKESFNNIKKLRELTGVGFKDCKLALDENNGDIDKSIEFLRKKGIAKASKKMSRTASEGLVLAKKENEEIAVIEINSETDFVAKNKDFINFCKELSDINFLSKGKLDELQNAKMKNNLQVKDNLVNEWTVNNKKVWAREELKKMKGISRTTVDRIIKKMTEPNGLLKRTRPGEFELRPNNL